METSEIKETTIQVCHGPVCRDFGAPQLAKKFAEKGLNVVVGGCQSQCGYAPCVHVDDNMINEATAEKIDARLEDIALQNSGL